ncbi:AMP-binding protein [Solimonas aquatica]|uniref:AMP-binding protein n=1 Tax=Solimonas aquatica TaxID=489703 RepID=UPI000B83E154|nr:AMP-binding protein [Solimonas aquatica]
MPDNIPSTARSSPWLPGQAPGPDKLARCVLRNIEDIRAVEKEAPDAVLPGPTILACLRASAARHPDKSAIVHLCSADLDVAPRILSYTDLLTRIQRGANLFRRIAGRERSSVSILLPMLPEALIAAWAGASAGIANPINPYLETRHIASIMNAARATVLVTTTQRNGSGAWERLDDIWRQVPTLRRILIVDADDPADDFNLAMDREAATLEFEPADDPHADAVYLPTGGTTAAPKLVRMSHRGQLLAAWIMGALAGSEPEGVVGHAMPNFHVGGGVILSLRAMLYGQTLLTLTTDGFRSQSVVKNFWDIARHYRMSSLIATPATAAALLSLPPEIAGQGHCIRSFNSGGSTVPVELLRGFHARYGIWLREIWGMSEIHGAVSGHPDDGLEPLAGSVGRRLPWHAVKAIEVDAQNRFLRECAPGERGVLVIAGPGVTAGYVDASLDQDFFVQGMPDGQRWANTGDLGMVDESGHIWLYGRAKDVIIRGGHNIDPRMVEEVLVSHPAVQLAAAIGKPDATKGEMPIAYVQLKPGARADAGDLVQLCREKVAERAAVPAEIHILDSMPMTAVGKINKPALRVDAMRGVAAHLARQIAGDGVSVQVDESGKRPTVVIRVVAKRQEQAQLQARLSEAFRSFEFLTRFEFEPA